MCSNGFAVTVKRFVAKLQNNSLWNSSIHYGIRKPVCKPTLWFAPEFMYSMIRTKRSRRSELRSDHEFANFATKFGILHWLRILYLCSPAGLKQQTDLNYSFPTHTSNGPFNIRQSRHLRSFQCNISTVCHSNIKVYFHDLYSKCTNLVTKFLKFS